MSIKLDQLRVRYLSPTQIDGNVLINGSISLNDKTPRETPQFILGIRAFADGGNIVWQMADQVSVGKASALTPITTIDKADLTNHWRRVWFSYIDNTTGRPAYDDRFVFQTSTGTLKAPVFSGSLSGNASTTTKLSTTRNIFGRPFDGTADVAGRALMYGDYNSDINNHPFTAALEIRENGLVGVNQTDIRYAPEIGFHWSGHCAGGLALGSDTKFRLLASNGNPATLIANLEADRIDVGGYNHNAYSLSTNSFICNSWVRTVGETGWYNETYGGGFFMFDDTWVRVYNNKKLYVSNTDSNAIYTSGGVLAGYLRIDNANSSGYIELSEDGEGGTIRLIGPNGSKLWEIDCWDSSNLRIFSHDGSNYQFFVFGANGILSAPGFSGSLNGNASTASALTPINATDQASSADTWRRIWMGWADNTTGRPAYDDRFAIQTSSGCLRAPVFVGNSSYMTQTTPSSTSYYEPLQWFDKNNKRIGAIGTTSCTNGDFTTHIQVQREINGRDYYQQLYMVISADGTGFCRTTRMYGAVWNDYAEYRSVETIEPGRVVQESADGIMKLTTHRLAAGCEIISDTFGFAIGETDSCKTPVATTGRVLAYTFEDRDSFELGQAVCSGPDGTVSKMTREEIMMYPERIIGTVSEIPTYTTWGSGNVDVNGRIWIRIR